jgi:integrase
MARPSTGGVQVDARGTEPVYRIRFRAGGKRRFQRLGTPAEGWTRERAEEALRHTLSDVERGLWQPPPPPLAEPVLQEIPTFHQAASDYLADQIVKGGRRPGGLTDKGREDLEWRLQHLLRCFAPRRLDAIEVRDVDAFTTAMIRKGLNATSVNKCLMTLAAVLEHNVEYGVIPKNVARGKGRKLASVEPRRTWIDRADHLRALLDGAGELDRNARVRKGQRRAFLATLALAGLRLGECLSLKWADVNLARGTLEVREGKTAAAARTVYLLPALRDELASYRARLDTDPDPTELVFGTATGAKQGATNIRKRIMAPAVEKANERLAKDELDPLPAGLTPHSLRRSFASVLCAIGEPPQNVMAQLGHSTPAVTLRFYAREMSRRDGERERLRALVQGEEWVPTGTEASQTTSTANSPAGAAIIENPLGKED